MKINIIIIWKNRFIISFYKNIDYFMKTNLAWERNSVKMNLVIYAVNLLHVSGQLVSVQILYIFVHRLLEGYTVGFGHLVHQKYAYDGYHAVRHHRGRLVTGANSILQEGIHLKLDWKNLPGPCFRGGFVFPTGGSAKWLRLLWDWNSS